MTHVLCENKHQDLGTVTEGENLQISYKITNGGMEDMFITAVHTDCGCTTASFPSVVIKPNESNTIVLGFKTNGRVGTSEKGARVTGNFTNPLRISFKVNVVK